MALEITLKIQDTEKTFLSTEDGYFCLNEVWEDFDMKASQHPSEWLDEVGDSLIELGEVFDLSENNGGIWATQSTLIMYASWADVEFFMTVLEAFTALTRSKSQEDNSTQS